MTASDYSNQYGDWQDEKVSDSRARWLDATLGELKVGEVLRVSPRMTVEQVLRRMGEQHQNAVLVMEGEALLGVLSEHDVLQQLLSRPDSFKLPVAEVMTRAPHAFTASTTLACALRDLALGQDRHIPVLDAVGRPTALLSARSLVQFIIQTFKDEILQGGLERDTACARASGEWPSMIEVEQELDTRGHAARAEPPR